MKRSSTLPSQKSRSWHSISKKKIIQPDDLGRFVQQLRKEKKTIATINGSFDLLHAGHLHILYEASKVAEILLIAVNSDESVRGYKGEDRPIIPLPYRMEMLTALSFVDYVTHFDEADPCTFLSTVRPDIHVNGAEYGENCVESKTLKQIGAKLHLVERIDGLATSTVIERIACASSAK